MKFLNSIHEDRFNELVDKSRIATWDIERKALFYILSGNEDLYFKSNFLYDFSENIICTEHELDLSGGMHKLVYLGFHLYNFNYKEDITIMDIFSNLDSVNFELALNAIKIRFNK